MSPLSITLIRFVRDEQGLATIEYAIAGALVAAALSATFTNLGSAVALRIATMANVIS